jgi:hypothetical protein
MRMINREGPARGRWIGMLRILVALLEIVRKAVNPGLVRLPAHVLEQKLALCWPVA